MVSDPNDIMVSNFPMAMPDMGYGKEEEFMEKIKDVITQIRNVRVTEKPATTYKAENGKDYVDFVDGKLIVMSVETNGGRKTFIITDPEYDEQTGTYTITTSENVYTVKIVDGKAVITFTENEKEEEKQE